MIMDQAKLYIKSENLDKNEIAHKMGISFKELEKLLNKQDKDINCITYKMLCDALNIKTDYLLNGIKTNPGQQNPGQQKKSKKELEKELEKEKIINTFNEYDKINKNEWCYSLEYLFYLEEKKNKKYYISNIIDALKKKADNNFLQAEQKYIINSFERLK